MLQKSKGKITSRLVKVSIILIPNPEKEQNGKKKTFLSEENLKDLLENIKYNNIHIIEVSEGRERKNALEKIFKEIVTEDVPNLG